LHQVVATLFVSSRQGRS